MLNMISLTYTTEELKPGTYDDWIIIPSSLAVKPTVQDNTEAVALNESLPLMFAYGSAVS